MSVVPRAVGLFVALSSVFGTLQAADPAVPPELLTRLTTGVRWTQSSVHSGGLSQGDPTRLSWSIVPDGTIIVPQQAGETVGPSDLRATLNQVYSSPDTWMPLLGSVFDRWSSLSGLTYAFENSDDGTPIRSSDAAPGVVGVRGDVRLAGHAVDGAGGMAAYAYFPDHGDMVLDTSDNGWQHTGGNSRLLRNVMAHEHGHSLGLDHVTSSDASFLMEPFLTEFFDGPQLDDILLVQRSYGDPLEKSGGNDSQSTPTRLGLITPGTERLIGGDALATIVQPNQTDFVSVDGLSDVDYFQFDVPSRGLATIVLRPLGPTYHVGHDGSSEQVLDTSALNDLGFQLLSAGSPGALVTVDHTSFGETEMIVDLPLPEAGSYALKVTGTVDLPQFYSLSIRVRASHQQQGDINGDGLLSVLDIDQMAAWLQQGGTDRLFDLNGDLQVNADDHQFLVDRLMNLYFGDSNLDGQFDSADLIQVFVFGTYEDQIPLNSLWQSGDWNGDLDFSTSDLVLAFQQASYEQGVRPLGAEPVRAVPEPAGLSLLAASLLLGGILKGRRSRQVDF